MKYTEAMMKKDKKLNHAEREWAKKHVASWKLSNAKRKRCRKCDTRNKTPYRCSVCEKGTCPDHSKLICRSCK